MGIAFRPFLDHFKFGACFSLSLTLHSLENLVTAHCFPDFCAHLAKFSQLKFREYSENITSRKFPALRYPVTGVNLLFVIWDILRIL